MNKNKQWLRYKLTAMSHFKEARKHGNGCHAPTHKDYFKELEAAKVTLLSDACKAMRSPIEFKLNYKIPLARAMKLWRYKWL